MFDNQIEHRFKGKESLQIILTKLLFMPNRADRWATRIRSQGSQRIEITDTIKENNAIIHISHGKISTPHEMFHAVVDLNKRLMTACNHTATHLLHHALRIVLGNHVEQKGSLVTPERLRFDFSHFARLTKEELRKVENEANRMVRENVGREAFEGVPMEEARRMGAIALFGEKYGDRVRVVKFGDSVELCGGTHVESTGRIGIIKIISEGGIAAGIRRIEALTAEKAREYINEKIDAADEIAALLKNSGNLRESVERLLAENVQLKNRSKNSRPLRQCQ